MKKNTFLKGMTIAALTLTMVSSTVVVNAAPTDDKDGNYVYNPTSIELEKVGEIKDPDGELTFEDETIFTADGTSEGQNSYKDYLGKDLKGDFSSVAALDDDETIAKYQLRDQYYIGYDKEEQIRYETLMDESMNVLLEGNIGLIERLNERYLLVIYADQVTDNEEEAVLYMTSDMLSIEADEDDILWTGYKTVYDLQAGKLIDSIKLTTPYSEITAVGDSLKIREDDGQTTNIYDASGKVIQEDAASYGYAGDFFYKRTEDDKTAVYDSSLNELFTSEYSSFEELDYHPDFLIFSTSDGSGTEGILDNTGKELYSDTVNIFGVSEDMIAISQDDKYGFIDNTGKEIIAPTYEYIQSYSGCGYYGAGEYPDYTMVNAAGKQVEDIAYLSPTYAHENTDDEYYIFSKGSFEAIGEVYDSNLAPYLVSCYDEKNGKYDVVEVIGGTELLKAEYDTFAYAYGYVYALKDGVYEVYKPVFK